MAGMRSITVRGVTYQFKVGSTYLLVRFPDGRPHRIGLDELTGRDVSRGRWKKTSDGMVRPEHVASFICSELKGGAHEIHK